MPSDAVTMRDAAVRQLGALARRGRAFREALAAGDPDAIPGASIWQRDCAAAINEYSGGSKAHWLSRAYSEALLVRRPDGGAVVEAPAGEIVDRVLAVIDQAIASLSRMEADGVAAPAPAPRRFDFVRNRTLRPILEQALVESGASFEAGDFTAALVTSCSILEAILTDRLEHCRLPTTDSGFEQRIAAAENAGLIRRGCARLPPAARAYRDTSVFSTLIVTARDAKVTRQVLHVVMRDLDPGR